MKLCILTHCSNVGEYRPYVGSKKDCYDQMVELFEMTCNAAADEINEKKVFDNQMSVDFTDGTFDEFNIYETDYELN